MELDGYYILSDLVDRPNLRQEAFAWLGSELLPALRRPGGLRGHWVEVLYGLASLLFIGLMGVLTVVLYRLILQGWLAGILSEAVAAGIVWVLTAVVLITALAAMISDLRGLRPQ
jgi:putative peptide zinc metalloprotease protein